MADSKVDIANMSLNLLGVAPIVSFGETSARAIAIRGLYSSSRDAVFRAHPWNCISKQAKLQKNESEHFGYDYSYVKPDDYLRIVRIKGYNPRPGLYEIIGESIASNIPSMEIQYVYREENTRKYDALLTSALVAYLAREMVMPLQVNIALYDVLNKAYMMKLSEAKSVDGMENGPSEVIADDFLLSRVAGNYPYEIYGRNVRYYSDQRYEGSGPGSHKALRSEIAKLKKQLGE